MPYLSKEALSKYIRTECKRQLRLYLTPDNQNYQQERASQQMPPPQPPRPGLAQIKEEGDTWQAEKMHDLTQAFGTAAIIGNPFTHRSGQIRYAQIDLLAALARAVPYHFLAEAQFALDSKGGSMLEVALSITNYRTQFGLQYAPLRPDLIVVLPPGSYTSCVLPNGEVMPLPEGDNRLQLRIIDIKLTAEPSPSYFAEVAYYSMALSSWLIDQHLDQQFVVVPNAAIWPGSHEASKLTVFTREHAAQGLSPTLIQLHAALEEDLEQVPYEVFAFRVRRFLQEELPEVLSTPSWKVLPWHVDHRCKGCEYLGYPWYNAQGQLTSDPDHCMPTAAQQDHLSRVAFIPRGASKILVSQGVSSVSLLAQRQSTDVVFDLHQVLRATRTVVAERASALQTQQVAIPPSSGTSAVMPRWTDLRIYLSTDFDLGSAISFAFGLKAFWIEPYSPASRNTQKWGPFSWVVDQKSLDAERRELLAFLNKIHEILTRARDYDAKTKVQFYLWDKLQYDHLIRVIGRHLQTILQDQTIQYLAWLFPAEDLLPNPAQVIRRSPITIVQEVVRTLLAAPIPHYYSLLALARLYHNPQLSASIAQFSIHPLFEDELSDQIPSERAHEIWARVSRPNPWQTQFRILQETVEKKLSALEAVTRRLTTDLQATLVQTAPPIQIGPPKRQDKVSFDGQLWYAFAKLDAALSELKIEQIWAMPPHEREARFHSARLSRRLMGNEEQQALAHLQLQSVPGRRVYELRATSREVKMREEDFNFALAPEGQPGFLDQPFDELTRGTPLEPEQQYPPVYLKDVIGVRIAGLDRDHLLVALDQNTRWPGMLDGLETLGLVDFSRDVILDPVYHDYFTKKLLLSLQAIGNPPAAREHPLVRRATGQTTGTGARKSKHVLAASLLWEAPNMYATPVPRTLAPVRQALEQQGMHLNPVQWQAWEAALSRQLQLIWGPPGTGKSRTIRAIIVGAALHAHQHRMPLRVLVCSATYTAIDNVLLEVYQDLQQMLPATAFDLYRVRSYLQAKNKRVPAQIDLELNKRQPSASVKEVRAHLKKPENILIIGATPEQIHNLLLVEHPVPQDEIGDLIVIDEASQMDVAHATLALCALAKDGSVILAGDPKQLPPIHQAEAPLGLETMVGSVYAFCEQFHQIPPLMLNENYRSNATLVQFSLNTGYQNTLTSYSPDLRLHLLPTNLSTPPANWPATLHWTPEWADLLDPDYPATCFVYPEGQSSQWNQFEADAVATLLYLLHGRIADQLFNERDPLAGQIRPASLQPYTVDDFWQKAVGVVTPHRAQMGLVVSRLQQLFTGTGDSPHLIREAVDTVERFQGQQRDVMIASYALGDPDAIQSEDEFLMSLNRFNVMASRARAKLIVLVSREIVDHLSSDLDVLRESRLLKSYVESFCQDARAMQLGYVKQGVSELVMGQFKRRK